jgi:hypothetical protein
MSGQTAARIHLFVYTISIEDGGCYENSVGVDSACVGV